MSLKARQKAIIDEFAIFDDPMDRYDYIIDLGKELPVLDQVFKTEANIVKGCQSKVWLRAFQENGNIRYEADSNTVITKGLIALLIRVFDNAKPKVIVDEDLVFINHIELRSHLSSQRSNGFSAMIEKMKNFAQAALDVGNENTVEESSVEESKVSALVVASNDVAQSKGSTFTPKDKNEIKEEVVGRIQTVFDPEIPVNIWDLGLIYDVTVFPPLNNVYILMTVTAPNCPVADSLPEEVKQAAMKVEGVGAVEVEMTFDPPWSKDMMSEVAKLELDMF